jgi:hypothetical protein
MTYGDRLDVMQITGHKLTLELKEKNQTLLEGTIEDLLFFLKINFFLPTLGEWLVLDQVIWRSSERSLGNGREETIDPTLHNQ